MPTKSTILTGSLIATALTGLYNTFGTALAVSVAGHTMTAFPAWIFSILAGIGYYAKGTASTTPPATTSSATAPVARVD